MGGMGILLQERNQSQRNAADCLSDIGEEKMSIYADDLSRMNKIHESIDELYLLEDTV